METKSYILCSVRFKDKVSIDFKRDTIEECLERISELLKLHGPIRYVVMEELEETV